MRGNLMANVRDISLWAQVFEPVRRQVRRPAATEVPIGGRFSY